VSPAPKPRDVIFFASPEELRAWFDEHHETADELWLGYHRKATGKPTVTWPEAVDEALCVGWIDGIRYRLDETRHAQRFTPRRKGSIWSKVNVERYSALRAAGLMTPAGERAYEENKHKTGLYSYENEQKVLTASEEERIRKNTPASADWEKRPPGYRKVVLHWITSAKKPETRAKRLATLIECSAAGQRIPGYDWQKKP